jgi:hypothetical protein
MLLFGDFGKIEVNILSRSPALDYWDGNWLFSNVIIKVGLFTANYNCNLRADEFLFFDKQLEDLLADRCVESQFTTMEEGLLLTLTKDLLGTFVLRGEAKNNDNYRLSLHFEVNTDYVQIEKLRITIQELLKKYPVVGSPG